MDDSKLDKVIKGLDSCIKQGRLGIDNCRELGCPYFENGLRLSCWIDVLTDAIELVREQQTIIITLKSNVEFLEGENANRNGNIFS